MIKIDISSKHIWTAYDPSLSIKRGCMWGRRQKQSIFLYLGERNSFLEHTQHINGEWRSGLSCGRWFRRFCGWFKTFSNQKIGHHWNPLQHKWIQLNRNQEGWNKNPVLASLHTLSVFYNQKTDFGRRITLKIIFNTSNNASYPQLVNILYTKAGAWTLDRANGNECATNSLIRYWVRWKWAKLPKKK